MKVIVLIVIFFLTITCTPKGTLITYDNFESDTLSKYWSKDKYLPDALLIQSENAKKGKKAVCLTLNSGDQIEEEVGSKSERAELKESKKNFSNEDVNLEYSFSLLLPKDFPITSTRLVIAQWKQNCKFETCTPDNPVIALRFSSGFLFITKQSSIKRDTLYIQNYSSQLGKWSDFNFKIRFTTNQNGRILTTLNKRKIIDYTGKTAYPKNNGEYAPPNKFYFKMGLYRDKSPTKMSIFFDNYTKKEIINL